MRWRFEPGRRQGKPVSSCFEQPYALILPRLNKAQTQTP